MRENCLTSITQKTFFLFFLKQVLISFRRIYLWVKVLIEVWTIMCDAQAPKVMFVFVRFGGPLGSVL